MLKIIKVTGSSLSPFFLPGDYVLVNTYRPGYKNLLAGNVVVFQHTEFGRLIKRVHTNFPGTENLKVAGSHENSISRLFPLPFFYHLPSPDSLKYN